MAKGEEIVELPVRLPAELEELLEHERAIQPLRTDVAARLTAKARASLPCTGAESPALSAIAGTLHPLGIAAIAGVGLVVGLAITLQSARQAKPVAPRVEHVATASAPVRSPALDVAAEVPASSPPRDRLRARPPESRSSVLEELRLLDGARRAYMGGDFAGVLASAAEHERLFPAGRLAEDREVLRLRAYVGLGRQRDARLEASRFRHMFPRSVLLPRIDDLLASTR